MNNHFAKQRFAIALLAVAAQASLHAQNFSPIAVTPGSFTQCMVIPSNWPYRLNAQSVSVTLDAGPGLQTDSVAGFPAYYSLQSGTTLFEAGLDRAFPALGMPAGGGLLTNVTLTDHVYQLGYWTNAGSNCMFIGNYTNGGTYNTLPLTDGPYIGQTYTNPSLTLTNFVNGSYNTNLYTGLSFLATAGSGPMSNIVVISYADGTTQTVPLVVPNWFLSPTGATGTNSATIPNPTIAYNCEARFNPAENQNGMTTYSTISSVRLFSLDVALSDTTSPATNVSFAWASGGRGPVFAVSGSTNTKDSLTVPNALPLPGPFTPISVTGFNAGCVVANAPQTAAGLAPLTATMDNGTNLAGGANTWFEKGWDTAAPTNGFPVHNSTIASGANPTFIYQMPPTYNGPMCVLVDVNHKSNNITPLNTNLSYTAFTLLTSGASIGNGNKMSNYIILQHADGVNESNTFIGYDWFEGTVSPAWVGQERCNIGTSGSTTGREVQNLDGGNPKLFDSEFPMLDATPVTNIVVGYRQAPSANSTTYVIAVSATTNFIVLQQPISYTPAQNLYPGDTAVFTVSNYVGTLPTYQWQVTDGATFTNNLNNGATGTGSTISGATTPTLTVANISAADTNYFYTCLLSNLAPSSVNSPFALMTLRVSTAANVVRPSDPISDFFGSSYTPGEAYPSPAGLTVNYAIDGTDEQYLNWGASGGTAGFAGPVGMIIQPAVGATVVNALRFIMPINAAICDPADFSLDGSPDGINWTNIVPDTALNLPNQRNLTQTVAVNVTNQVLDEIDFPNTYAYSYYRVTFQNVKNNVAGVTANSLQIGEIQLLGGLAPLSPQFFKQPSPPTQSLLVGGGVTWSVVANGPGPISYQWYQVVGGNGQVIPGATGTSFSVTNVTLGSSGASFFCLASNSFGVAPSSSVSYTVSTSTGNYVSAILADGPIAFFRLDEATNNPATLNNDGVIAYDIVGGHDGIYSNTILQVPGISTNDTANYAADFGTTIDPATTANPRPSTFLPQDNCVSGISGINFSTPTNFVTNLSVEAWVNLNSSTQISGAGIVAAGWGGAEQFALDMGGGNNDFRFYFRNAATNSVTVSAGAVRKTNVWYHVAAVLNEQVNVTNATYTNYAANESLYLNGVLVATNQVVYSNAPGILVTNPTIAIGARPSGSATNFNLQLNGSVANAAIYNYGLTAAQVSNHFASTLVGPGILVQPSPLVQSMQVGGSFTWSMTAYGPGPITYQWYRVVPDGIVSDTNAVPNATNAIFNLVNAAGAAGYFCTASNPYGSTNTILVNAAVVPPSSPYVSAVVADGPISFFRLDEGPDSQPNDGVIAYDSIGGHNGYYSNVVLQYTPGYSTNDPLEAAADFGYLFNGSNLNQDNVAAGINGVNFATPTNTTRSFSVEAWVNLFSDAVSGAGIVSKGAGGGGEEFALDTGGTAAAFRFYFRTAGSNSPAAASPNTAPTLGIWYHLVGVLYESNNVVYEYLYTNGLQASAQTIVFTNPPGILANDAAPVVIGARPSAAATNYNLQLNGLVANVAIYPYALTAAQVQNHYLASGIAPIFTQVPTNATVLQGTINPAVFYSQALGTSNALNPLVYQWQYNGVNLADGPSPSGTGATISGSTTPTLTISGFTPGDNGDSFTVVVTNSFGAISASASLTVAAGPPSVVVDLASPISVLAGSPLSLSASFTGTSPFIYQWTYNGAPLVNGGRVSGATTNTLTIAPAVVGDSGTYQLLVTNIYGSGKSSAAVVTVVPILGFNGYGTGWSVNSSGITSAPFSSPNTLVLTDGGGGEGRSSFFSNAMYVGAFQATYTYTDVGGNGANADGVCFVVQNDARGSVALGGAGGSLGYGTANPITPSVALEFNIYTGNGGGGVGIGLATNGAIVSPTSPYPVLLNYGDPINVTVNYFGGVATIFLQDANTPADAFTASANINIPAVLGTNLAYVGFTGATGGVTAYQTIQNFQFIPFPNLTASLSSGNIQLSWPSGTGAFLVQSISNLASTNWVNVAATVVATNNQNVVTVPLSAGPAFYRLQLQ